MQSSKRIERGSGTPVFMLLLVIVFAGGIYLAYTQSASLRGAFHSMKESTEDATTTSKVHTALLLSKRVAPFNIKVETTDGNVTLTGQVPSDEFKNLAAAITLDTPGVKRVQNDLGINPTAERNPESERLGERVADLEVKTAIDDAISSNSDLRGKNIDVQVKDQVVKLGGTLQTTAEKTSAEQIAWQTSGVKGVTNNISVTDAASPETADEKLSKRVEFELYSTRAVSLKNVQIHANNGTVTLSGNVGSRAQLLLADKIAQSVDGVRNVVNNLDAPDEMQP